MRRIAFRYLAPLLAATSVLAPQAASAQPSAPPGGAKAAGTPAPKLTRAPKLAQFVEAPYPDSERAAGRAASVVLQIAISAAGHVDEVAVAESAGPAFDQAAVEAARKFVFEPAEIDGKPAPVKIAYRYEFVLRVEQKTTAIFSGVVRERATKRPIAGVHIDVADGGSAITGDDGRFTLDDVPPGKHAVTISGDTLTAQQTSETFEAAKELDATYDVTPKGPVVEAGDDDDLEIVVTPPPLEKKVVSTEVSADEAKRIPGTQGDVLKVVENLPGVARGAVGSGALVVWGAAPEDTRVYIDGVRVPRLYHDGGLRSVVHSDLVKSVELAPGGYGAAYGRGLGGLVTVQTRALETDTYHGSVAVDLLDAAVSARAPITDKLRVGISGRRSHLDGILKAAASKDVEDYFPIPHYYDGQARAAYQIGPRESVEFGGLLSGDRTSRSVAAANLAERKTETRALHFQRVYARYEKQLDDGATVSVVPYVGADASTLESRFGVVPTNQSITTTLYGLRAIYRGRLADQLGITVGLDAEVSQATLRRSGSVSAPAREGDIRVFGQPPTDQINVDDWKVTQIGLAPYAEADIALFKERLHILPGLRFDPQVSSVSRRTPLDGDTPSIGRFAQDAAVDPRLAIRFAATAQISLRAAYGFYHRSPLPEDLSAVFGNPSLTAARASQALVGAAFRLTPSFSIETTAFRTESSGLAVRSTLSSPLLAEALVGMGQGRAFGAQFLLRKELGAGFFGWVSYSIVRSERQDVPEGRYRAFDYDQTHVLTALASYDLGRGFEVGARIRFATGFPRTPVLGAYYDGRRDAYQPIFGEENTSRIPAFVQGDVRFTKRWKIGRSELEAYLEVQNVTNRKNPEEVVYSSDYRQKGFITGLPILPVAGLKWSL